MSPHARAHLLRQMHSAAIAAADPLQVLPPHLPAPPRGRTVLIALGKAALSMARAVTAHWPAPLTGLVVAPQATDADVKALPGLKVMVASHPVPDETSVAASQAVLDALVGLGPDDLVLALVSGGGSSLLAMPAAGISLREKQEITRVLLRSGATIHEMNVVRRHLSAVKGGRLAMAAVPARVVTLVISDIPGDDPHTVASGPTLPDGSTCTDAVAVLQRYRVPVRCELMDLLRSGNWESPKAGDPCFQGSEVRLVARAQDGLAAAARVASAHGVFPLVLSDRLEGEARTLADFHAAIAFQVRHHGQPVPSPCVLLSGGEATVTVRGGGRGGRNTEFALAFALAMRGEPGVSALSAGTDGVDGTSEAAGALVDETTLERAHALGLDPLASLRNNDSFTCLDSLDACIYTGPTGTNINDVRAVMVDRMEKV